MDLSILQEVAQVPALTPMQAVTYCGIPSLIYCAMTKEASLSTDIKFDQRYQLQSSLRDFLCGVIEGKKSIYPELQRYATVELRGDDPISIWPPVTSAGSLKAMPGIVAMPPEDSLTTLSRTSRRRQRVGRTGKLLFTPPCCFGVCIQGRFLPLFPLLENVPTNELGSIQIKHVAIPDDFMTFNGSFHSFIQAMPLGPLQ